jgi:L-threonylcarbamoyladenylate synthase
MSFSHDFSFPIALPTETVYGLAVDGTCDAAVARVYALKARPLFNPLILHVPDLASAQQHGIFDENALCLARQFWPGPLSLVVPLKSGSHVCDLARAGLPTLALRVPDHPVAQEVLRQCAIPLAAPSANRSGRISPTCTAHVRAEFGDTIPILEGGPCRIGLESTIIACVDGTVHLLRPGGITREVIETALGRALETHSKAVIAPGMLLSHYAPDSPLRLDATQVKPDEALLLFGTKRPSGWEQVRIIRNLSETEDLMEAATNLFSFLRQLDATKPKAIAVSPIPSYGLGEAIQDRLKRAAVSYKAQA